MVLGIGTDIVQISRIERLYKRYGDRFLDKFLSRQERELIPGNRAGEFLAGRFAAKESLVKALGGRMLPADSISILRDDTGRPYISPLAPLEEILSVQKLRAHISISHDGEYATAMVVLESAD